MTRPPRMSTPSPLRAWLAALPLDRAPLRRAGLLSLLLVALLAAGKVFGPGRPVAAAALPDRNEVTASAEGVSASRPAAPRRSAWTGGRVVALMLLAAGGGIAVVLHRRRPAGGAGGAAAVDVIETRSLGPNQSLQLVACADEVLLLAVGAEGATLLRHWPRARFDGSAESSPVADAPSFAEVLAAASDAVPSAVPDAAPAVSASAPRPAAPTSPVPTSPAPTSPAPPPTPRPAPPADARTWGLHQFGSAHA